MSSSGGLSSTFGRTSSDDDGGPSSGDDAARSHGGGADDGDSGSDDDGLLACPIVGCPCGGCYLTIRTLREHVRLVHPPHTRRASVAGAEYAAAYSRRHGVHPCTRCYLPFRRLPSGTCASCREAAERARVRNRRRRNAPHRPRRGRLDGNIPVRCPVGCGWCRHVHAGDARSRTTVLRQYHRHLRDRHAAGLRRVDPNALSLLRAAACQHCSLPVSCAAGMGTHLPQCRERPGPGSADADANRPHPWVGGALRADGPSPAAPEPRLRRCLDFVRRLWDADPDAVCNTDTATLVSVPGNAVASYAYALAAVLRNLPSRAPRPGDTFSEKDYREAMRETPRGAAAGPAGDRADHWLAAYRQSDMYKSLLFRYHNHVAHGDTPAALSASSPAADGDRLAWYLALYLLPRWLLHKGTAEADKRDADFDARADPEGVGFCVRERVRLFLHLEWEQLHARAADAPGGGGADAGGDGGDGDGPASHLQRRGQHARFQCRLGEVGRGAKALTSTDGAFSRAACARAGDRADALWARVLGRVLDLHPEPAPGAPTVHITDPLPPPDDDPGARPAPPRLGGLPPELRRLHFASKLVLLHKGTDAEFDAVFADAGSAGAGEGTLQMRPIAIGSSHHRAIARARRYVSAKRD